MTAAGGGIAVISGFAGLIVWGISGMDRAWNGSEERAIERHSTQALLGIFAGGLLVAAPGLAWMALRLRHRRAYSNEHAEELRTLKRRRGELRQQLRVGFSLEPRQVGLRLHTTF